MSDLLIKNVRPWGQPAQDLYVHDGFFSDDAPSKDCEVIDGNNQLILPGLVNAHAHVDKSWCGKPWQSYAGEATTQGRIAHERARRDELGIPGADVTRATLNEMIRTGTTAIRTHVDVDLGIGLSGLEIVRETASQMVPGMRIELIAFPQDGVLRRPGVATLLRQAAANGVEHIGGLDPAGIDRDPVGQLDILFDIAGEHGCGIDIHLHDAGELGAFEMELIIERIKATSLQGMVNLAHGFAIADVTGVRQAKLIEQLAEQGVSFSTVAPVGRPPMPIKALRKAGIPVGLGTDGFRDLWSPYGTGDMMLIAVNHARMTGHRFDEELAWVMREATSAGLYFVGNRRQQFLDEPTDLASQLKAYYDMDFAAGVPADFIMLDAENPMDALVRSPRRELVVIGGQVVARAGEMVI